MTLHEYDGRRFGFDVYRLSLDEAFLRMWWWAGHHEPIWDVRAWIRLNSSASFFRFVRFV